MLNLLKRLFNKDEEGSTHFSVEGNAKFLLKVDQIVIGELYCQNGHWEFKYSEDFKKRSDEYNPIIGFSDLNKIYKNESLWPFFKIRIPGLKQPAVQEIIAREHLDKADEVQLLKRFGHKTISNPYELEFV